jgi:hypothetical protein
MPKPTNIREFHEALSLAQPLIREHHKHLVDARILFLITDQKMKSKDRVIAGKAAKNPPLVRFLSSYKDAEVPSVADGYDFIITIQEDEWVVAPPARRLALLDHELSHCIQKIDARNGDYAWAVTGHDLEELFDVIERHGLEYARDVKEMAKVVAQKLDLSPVPDGDPAPTTTEAA